MTLPLRIFAAVAPPALLLLSNSLSFAETLPQARHILFVTSDDLGYGDLSVHGASDIPTPCLDAFAGESVRFRNGYVTAPVCAPSRMGMLTGVYQQYWGILRNHLALPREAKTLANMLRDAGYRTDLVGKWHLGKGPGLHPLDRGFDGFFGFLGWGTSYFNPKLERDRHPIEASGYVTVTLADEAIRLISDPQWSAQPWFLMLNFNAPHAPMEALPEEYEKLTEIADQERRTYAAMVTTLDREFGRVLEALKRSGQDRDTLVVFVNDNGAGGASQKGTSNRPLRGKKYGIYEGGIKVPFFLRWPAGNLTNRDFAPPVSTLDLVPTILAACGVPSPAVDGINLLPLFASDQTGERCHYWLAESKDKEREWLAVRAGDWKLHRRKGASRTYELYNLRNDPEESVDLTADHPDIVKRLDTLLTSWCQRFGHLASSGHRSENADP